MLLLRAEYDLEITVLTQTPLNRLVVWLWFCDTPKLLVADNQGSVLALSIFLHGHLHLSHTPVTLFVDF